MGTNYVRAKKQMQNDDDELLTAHDWNKIQSEMKSHGMSIKLRVARAPWIQGGVEAANKSVIKLIPSKKLSLFKFTHLLEYIMFHVNRRPIGFSTADDVLSPSDVIPVWSRLNPGNMMGVSKCLKEAMNAFSQ